MHNQSLSRNLPTSSLNLGSLIIFYFSLKIYIEHNRYFMTMLYIPISAFSPSVFLEDLFHFINTNGILTEITSYTAYKSFEKFSISKVCTSSALLFYGIKQKFGNASFSDYVRHQSVIFLFRT